MSKTMDLTNQTFGKLTVVRRAEDKIRNGNNIKMWLCKCECGNETIVPLGHLRSGHTTSCGKCRAEDLTGKKFGHWTVLGRSKEDYISPSGVKSPKWDCQCDCERHTIKSIRGMILKNGDSTSCGCISQVNLHYDLSGSYGIGYTVKNEPFYFDLEDFDLIKQYNWSRDKDNYMVANYNHNGKKTTIKMHRLVLGILNSKYQADHIYHVNYDNRKSQLRIVSSSQNNMNTKIPKNNKSGHKGVTWNIEKKKYEARITINLKRIFLGYFSDYNDAVKAREQAEIKYFGEYNYTEDKRNLFQKLVS